MKVILAHSNKRGKKWMVTFSDDVSVHFGAKGYSDYPKHQDEERKQRYIQRHGGSKEGLSSTKEDWSKSGIRKAGFWSRWLLWNKPSMENSIIDIKKRFGIEVKFP